jgi:hypothetical protein
MCDIKLFWPKHTQMCNRKWFLRKFPVKVLLDLIFSQIDPENKHLLVENQQVFLWSLGK